MSLRISIVLAFISFTSIPLVAQDYPKAEVYGGYQRLHDSDLKLNGFRGEVAGNFNSVFGIVGEFGAGIKDISEFGVVNLGLREYTFLAGPRLSVRTDKFRAFVHVLGGGTRYSGGVDALGFRVVGASTTGFAWDFGGGVEFPIGKNISVRPAQLDYLDSRISFDVLGVGVSGWQRQLRYSGGIVFKFGGSRR
jgi:hypothetical protein